MIDNKSEIEEIRPKCRYSQKELETIAKALGELSKHEENMIAFNTGFGTPPDVSRSKAIQYRLNECITAINDMILTDI